MQKFVLYYTKFYGDSFVNLWLTVYEMDKPMSESAKYYSNFDPQRRSWYVSGGLKTNKVYTLTNLNETDSTC